MYLYLSGKTILLFSYMEDSFKKSLVGARVVGALPTWVARVQNNDDINR
jgi:hypothetical protein